MSLDQQFCGTQCQAPPITSQRYLVATIFPLVFLLGALLCILIKRRHTKWLLQRRGLPTVMWRPRFINYRPFEEDQKLSSFTITRVLPRMERLKGPYGMYGTVYGLNTAVIHVAHPVPARAIFGTTSGTTSSSLTTEKIKPGRRSTVACSTGASKAPAYDHFKNFCGEGVFTADGEEWKAKRTSVMHCLIRGTNSANSDVAKRLEHEANHAADVFIAQVLQQQNSLKSDCVVANVVPLLQRSTVGLIYRYITHHDPSWGDDNSSLDDDTLETTSLTSADSSTDSTCQEHKKGIQEESNGLLEQYLKSIIRIRMIILAQSRSIWFVLPRWCYTSFSSLYRDEEATVLPIRSFAEQACKCAKPGSPLDQLQKLDTHNKIIPGQVSPFSKDLLDEAITLLFAGQDTSAATLSWTIHLLSIYPEIQSRLAEDLRNVVLKDSKGNPGKVKITRQLISKLPFLDAVVKESMRLYPVAPFVVRRIQDELCIDDPQTKEATTNSKVILPAGSVACIWIYSLHRNPRLWHRPNDFVPDRWLEESCKDIGQTNGAYMPFAAGPRNCVGQPIAQVVLRTLLARLLLKFEFRDERLDSAKSPDDLRIEMQAGFTVLPSGGVTVIIRPRDNALSGEKEH